MDTHQRKVPIHKPQFQICEIVHCLGYAPIEGAEEEAKDYFYDTLQATVERIPKHDVLLLLGDFNARVGSNNDNQGNALKRHGVGVINDNCERLCDLCESKASYSGWYLLPA